MLGSSKNYHRLAGIVNVPEVDCPRLSSVMGRLASCLVALDLLAFEHLGEAFKCGLELAFAALSVL